MNKLINQFTQFFDNPKVSIFDRSTEKGFDAQLGVFYPCNWDLLNFGNSYKGNSGHKLRLAPLLAPSYSDLRLQEHTAVVPVRVIMNDYETKWNYAIQDFDNRALLPHFTMEEYLTIIRAMLISGVSPVGSLFDFLGFPVFADIYNAWLSSSSFTNGPVSIYDAISREDALNELDPSVARVSYYDDFNYRGTSIDWSVPVYISFYNYIALASTDSLLSNSFDQIVAAGRFYTQAGYGTSSSSIQTELMSLDKLIAASKFETVVSATESYLSFLFNFALDSYIQSVDFPDQNYTTLPLRAYWRLHFDWNINGNFVDRDTMLSQYVFNIEDNMLYAARAILNTDSLSGDERDMFFRLVQPANRLWDDDFFTSLLPTSKADNAIEIPANSTVLDMAKFTALQKLVLKLSFSSRYRDTIWNVFKIMPSDARLQQSSIINQRTHQVGIGESIQTSETTVSSVLGSFAGRGYSSGKGKTTHIFCEEPCIIFNLMSLVPRASYADALHPLIHVDDIYDLPIPDMDVLGLQPITSDLVSGNPSDYSTILGYGRQYQEWLVNYSTVHNHFKTNLRYWQLTRRFMNTPVINDDFLRYHPADDFDMIFSVPDASHSFISVYYNSRVTRHVHRSLRIQI